MTGDDRAGERPATPDTGEHRAWARRLRVAAVGVCVCAFAAAGVVGVGRYIETFWLYRGYAAPSGPSSVVVATASGRRSRPVVAGEVVHLEVKSAALGGSSVPVLVYLPPGYFDHPDERYPSLYLLHGFPGQPEQFVDVGDIATLSDVLVAESKTHPMIIVMPSGSHSFLVDNEWANDVRPDNNWETFVARDLVNEIDRRYRTIRSGSERGIGGLSEGAYGALNISFHHLGEFGLIEAWSPYYIADKQPALFGTNPRLRPKLLFYNSPVLVLPKVAATLRRDHTYIWIYCGTKDYTVHGSRRFAAALTSLDVAHSFKIEPGRHDWSLWRTMMPSALTTASQYFAHGLPAA